MNTADTNAKYIQCLELIKELFMIIYEITMLYNKIGINVEQPIQQEQQLIQQQQPNVIVEREGEEQKVIPIEEENVIILDTSEESKRSWLTKDKYSKDITYYDKTGLWTMQSHVDGWNTAPRRLFIQFMDDLFMLYYYIFIRKTKKWGDSYIQQYLWWYIKQFGKTYPDVVNAMKQYVETSFFQLNKPNEAHATLLQAIINELNKIPQPDENS